MENQALNILNLIKTNFKKNLKEEANYEDNGIFFVLHYLYDHDGLCYSGTLAKVASVSTARIAALLNKMEKRKLVRRKKEDNDLRKTIVILEEEGKKIFEERRKKMIEFVNLLIERFGYDFLVNYINETISIDKAIKELRRI